MQRRLPSLVLLLAWLAPVACGNPGPTTPIDGACVPACGADQTCVAGACQAASVTGTPAATGTTTGGGAGSGVALGQGGTSTTGSMAGAGVTPNTGGMGAGGANTSSGTNSAGTSTTSGGGASAAGGTTTAGAGAETAGNGPGAAGASGGATGAGGSGTTPANLWHASIATAVTDAVLLEEYEAWKAAHVEACNDGTNSVDKGGSSVVSEGIGYGMLLSANMDDRPLFDGLWAFYQAHVDANGLMNWSMDVCAAAGDNRAFAATDADLDAAMALVQAAAVWPDGAYLADAEALAAKILEFETDDCDGQVTLRPGDNWGGCRGTENRINPSYFAPGYYRAFAAHFATQAERWTALVEDTYALYPGYAGATAEGPYPDWSNSDGSSDGSGYNYDAARVPWRIATDYAWSGDARAVTELERIAAFVDGQGGIPVAGKDNNSTFSGAFALAGVTDGTKLDAYVADWLAAGGDDGPYFQGTLRVLYLLVAGGKFPSTF